MTFKSEGYLELDWLIQGSWLLREAVALMFGDYPVNDNGFVSVTWSDEHQKAYVTAKKSIDIKKLEAVKSKDGLIVNPVHFAKWAKSKGYSTPAEWRLLTDEKDLEDDEITIERFFPALCASLSSKELAFRKLDELREYGVIFRSAQKGCIGDESQVEGIGIAITKAGKVESITAVEATVQVKLVVSKYDIQKVRLCDLFIRRDELEAAYQKLGVEEYPWPGFDPFDRCAVLERKIQSRMQILADTHLEMDSKERAIAEYERELAELRHQKSSPPALEDSDKNKAVEEESKLSREEQKRKTMERYQSWADKVNECQKKAKNDIVAKNLTRMSEEAAKQLLQINHPDETDADSYYKRYFHEKNQSDWERLADGIRRSELVKKSFRRK